MRRLPIRKNSSVVNAVKREVAYGGDGRFFYMSVRRGTGAHQGHWNNHKSAETFDEREARTAKLDFEIYRSFVRAVTLKIQREVAP